MQLASGTDWQTILTRATEVAPEAFDGDVLRNLIQGQWRAEGRPSPMVTPVDGTILGKLSRLDFADVDRALDGVRWYVDEIDRQTHGRVPLTGPVSNIASWNYPMSVLVHAELVQLLAGNAVIAKTPSQGGAVCLTVAHALMRRAGLPCTLLSGSGDELSQILVRAPEIGAVAF